MEDQPNNEVDQGRTFTFEELREHFHRPINEVSQELGICATLLKKVCRQNGIRRWPHRKIKSLDTLIENFEEIVRANPAEAEIIQADIAKLKKKREFLLQNPNVSYNDVVPKHVVNGYNIRINKLLPQVRSSSPMPDLTESGSWPPTRTIDKANLSRYPRRSNRRRPSVNYQEAASMNLSSSSSSDEEEEILSPAPTESTSNTTLTEEMMFEVDDMEETKDPLRDSITSVDEDSAASMLLCLHEENTTTSLPPISTLEKKESQLPFKLRMKQRNVLGNPPMVHESGGIRALSNLLTQVEHDQVSSQ